MWAELWFVSFGLVCVTMEMKLWSTQIQTNCLLVRILPLCRFPSAAMSPTRLLCPLTTEEHSSRLWVLFSKKPESVLKSVSLHRLIPWASEASSIQKYTFITTTYFCRQARTVAHIYYSFVFSHFLRTFQTADQLFVMECYFVPYVWAQGASGKKPPNNKHSSIHLFSIPALPVSLS